jgi:hypothetical protein
VRGKNEYEGSGLGLSMQEIVDIHRPPVCFSVLAKGLLFIVELPGQAGGFILAAGRRKIKEFQIKTAMFDCEQLLNYGYILYQLKSK